MFSFLVKFFGNTSPDDRYLHPRAAEFEN